MTTSAAVTAAVGDWLVVCISADNAGSGGSSSIAGVSDSQSNTWTERLTTNQDPAGASAGITLAVYTCEVTSALTNGTVTVSFSPNTTSKTFTVQRIQPGSGEIVTFDSVGAGSTGAGTTMSAGAVSVTNGHTIFGATAIESLDTITADSDTTNGSWSTQYTEVASTGTQATSARIGTQFKTVTATDDQTYNTTTGSSRDYAINYMIVYPDTAQSLDIVADLGEFVLTGEDAGLLRGFPLIADLGAFALTGNTTDLLTARLVGADAGAFVLSGNAVELKIATGYTREGRNTLPADNADLAVDYSSADKDDVATDDDVFVSATGLYAIHQYKTLVPSTAYPLEIRWKGKSSAPASKLPVKIEIWDVTESEWVLLATNSTAAANTEFQITVTVPAISLSDYLGNETVSVRVWTGGDDDA